MEIIDFTKEINHSVSVVIVSMEEVVVLKNQNHSYQHDDGGVTSGGIKSMSADKALKKNKGDY